MNSEIKVIKSDGSKVNIDLDKIHKMVEKSCRNITGVSESLVEMNSGLQFYDGITTQEIQKILVKSASDLITLDNPNYQFVAARLLLFAIQKQVFNTKWKDAEIYPLLREIIDRNIDYGVYDKDILSWYTDEEIDKCNTFIKHSRDLNFTYAGLQQIVDKYLVQDRSTGTVFETPQFMYMLISMTLFKNYDNEIRLDYVKRWREFELLYDNLHRVCSLTQTTLSTAYSQVIWPLENMLHNELESVLTQEELEDLGQKLEEAKSSIRESSHSLKNLSQLLDVAPKMESEGVQQQFTFQYGTKKSKTLSSSKIIKGRRTIVSES